MKKHNRTGPQRGEIQLKNETLAKLDAYLLSRGVPLPPGCVKRATDVSVRDDGGNVLPSAGRILQKRPDGSIEWLLLDILLRLDGQETKSIFVEPRAARAPKPSHPVTVTTKGRETTLANGLSALTVSRAGGSLIRKLVVNGKIIVNQDMLVDLETVDDGGKIHRASQGGRYKITIPHHNPLRSTVMIEGRHQARDGATFLEFALRLTLTADSPDVTLEHTFYCREPREGKIAVRSMKLLMPTTMSGSATKLLQQKTRGYDSRPYDLEVQENIELVAAATGDIDNYRDPGANVAHQAAGGAVFLRNPDSYHEDWDEYPFHMRPGQRSGFRSWHASVGMRHVQPVVGWKQQDVTLVTAFEHFRQLHPKAIDIDENRIAWSIWPAWATPMQVVRGVSKSHIIRLTAAAGALDMDDVLDVLGRWEYGYVEPVDVSFDPAWAAACEVLDCQHLLRYQPRKYPLLENLIEVAPAAANPSRHTYDRMPATGMFHFGDVVSGENASTCCNNEDDLMVFFPLQQFLRTGHTYCWDYGKEAARHYMEVDFCEWSPEDRQRGGLIAHTGQHFIGCVYPSHQWAEGLLAYYYLSGDERARKALIGCGDNNVWWAYNKTECICIDGREAGMPLLNLAAAHRLTRDPKYLDAARHICENFFLRYMRQYGSFKYSREGITRRPRKLITGYGDWSSFAGLYRLWETSGDAYFKDLGVTLLQQAVQPGAFSLNDVRGMDFFAAWTLGRMTGNMDDVFERIADAVPMLLRRGGHPLRRLHFLKEMDDRGLIDETMVGNRPGAI